MDIAVRTDVFAIEDRSWLGSAFGTNATRTITLDLSLFDPTADYPLGFLPSGMVLGQVTSTSLWGPYSGTTDEKQSVTVTGAPTGGTFTLTFSGQTTAAIAYNATAAAVQSALAALSNIGAGNVAVTGANGGPYTVSFIGALANTDVAQMTATPSLTGGTSPGVTIATTTAGGADASSDGRQVAKGFLFDTIDVSRGVATKFGAPLLEWGAIVQAKLPAQSHIDPNALTDLAGRFTFR
jgi:hypothetical protein